MKRDRVSAVERVHRDFCWEEPRYNEQVFEDRYRMPKSLFLKITHAIEARFEYFQEGYDARQKKKASQPYKNVRLPLSNSQPVIHRMSLTNIYKWLKERHVNAFNFFVMLLFRYTVEITYVGQQAMILHACMKHTKLDITFRV